MQSKVGRPHVESVKIYRENGANESDFGQWIVMLFQAD